MLEQIWDILDGSLDGSNDGKLEGLLLGGSKGSTDCRVIGSDEGIKLGYTDNEVLVTIIGNLMESHLGFVLEQSWALLVYTLIILIRARLRAYCSLLYTDG